MGTVAAVQVRGGDVAVVRDVVKTAFDEVNREFNAHDPQSAINRLGGCTAFGRPCADYAAALAEASGGAFNPAWKGDGSLDYGAIAKGFALDVAAARLKASGLAAADVLLDLGGNLKAVRGEWRVGLMDPLGGALRQAGALRDGEAMATSATYFRGRHIHDGRTGAVVSNDVASVTVRCASAMRADALSTALFILGPSAGRELLSRHAPDASAVFVMADGRQVEVSGSERRQRRASAAAK